MSKQTHNTMSRRKKLRRGILLIVLGVLLGLICVAAGMLLSFNRQSSDKLPESFLYSLDWKTAFMQYGGEKLNIVSTVKPQDSLTITIVPITVSPLSEEDRFNEYARCIVIMFEGRGTLNKDTFIFRGECLMDTVLEVSPTRLILKNGHVDKILLKPQTLPDKTVETVRLAVTQSIGKIQNIEIPLNTLTAEDCAILDAERLDLHKDGVILYKRGK